MFARIGVVLATTICFEARAAAQAAAPPDVRLLTLRSLQVGRMVRISGRDVVRLSGRNEGVRDSVLWLGGGARNYRVPVDAIDSVWVDQGHARPGAIVGGLIGVAVAFAAVRVELEMRQMQTLTLRRFDSCERGYDISWNAEIVGV